MTDLKNIYTGLMTNEKDFRKAIGTNNIEFVNNSLNDDFKPKKGDVFVRRTSSGGHTGIIYKYDESLEAIGPGGSRDNSTNKMKAILLMIALEHLYIKEKEVL